MATEMVDRDAQNGEAQNDIGSGDNSQPGWEQIADTQFVCNDCTPSRSFDTKRGLARHRSTAHGDRKSTRRSVEVNSQEGFTLTQTREGIVFKAPNSTLQKIGDELIGNVSMIGTAVTFVAPHTGFTILSRAPLMGKGIMEIASRNEQVLNGVKRFNQIFTGGELGTAIASIAVAVAVDVGQVNPDGMLASMMIGDVVQQVKAMNTTVPDGTNPN